MKKALYLLPLAALMAACSPQTYVAGRSGKNAVAKSSDARPALQPVAVQRQLTGMMPKATAFRMTGDYARNVAITLAPDGSLSYFPAPSDISASSAPTDLGDGWWLNNQGIGPNSVFTKYTFEEYAALPSAPSAQELKDAILPGASVSEMVTLPFTIGEARSKTSEIKSYLNEL